MNEQWLGLITGICFGALLQQGRVLRFEKQVGAMLLKDMTIMKFMMSAILVGLVGIHLAVAWGLAQLSPKATQIGANVVGGLLFGLGEQNTHTVKDFEHAAPPLPRFLFCPPIFSNATILSVVSY